MEEIDAQLFSKNKALLLLTDNDFDIAKRAYTGLVDRHACMRGRVALW